MVEEQRDIQAQCDPLSSTHEHQAEEPVDGVLWYHQLTRADTGSQTTGLHTATVTSHHTSTTALTTIYESRITLRGKHFHTEGVNVTHGSLLLRVQI